MIIYQTVIEIEGRGTIRDIWSDRETAISFITTTAKNPIYITGYLDVLEDNGEHFETSDCIEYPKNSK